MKHFVTLLCFLLFASHLFAQNAIAETENSDDDFKEFIFVYVGHEEADAIDIISRRLKDMKNNADQYGNAYIFYLANGNSPLIVKCNLKDENPEDFNKLIGELNNAVSHSVDPVVDMKNILQLLDEYDYLDENGNLKYFSTTMDFYVGADFWTLGYNESLLAKLYFILDVPTLKKMDKEFIFRVNSYKENYPKYPEGKPYGEKNLVGINNEIILQYSN